ncbi:MULTISPECIES: Tex family protein [unclassified Salinivibrio]|uniref:Tex family protein n=1 Tax=unclassified Salinivibrio TaxID=2636825 RepID=UPI000987CB30|nr:MULTISPECIES: Tex family protein [unclassified Salinivibrio]OOF14334.1 RNA-binding transcriptional accessory protein [Salinivibrio sp. PR919]OOF18756.1 RNA-binding transcriptional accessory protein [Salinivibrio sp. PR932]
MHSQLTQTLAKELNVSPNQVATAVALLDDGNTVPFIARYRKEATQGLDDSQLRTLETRLVYLREMEARRDTILKSIDEQGKLTDSLRRDILAADSKNRLEDLYLPYKPKRRTKGQIAIEAGLEPLAEALWQDASQDPDTLAQSYLNPEQGIADTKAALDGARAIMMERLAEDAALLDKIRQYLNQHAVLRASVVTGQEEAGAKFKDYFDHQEPISKVPSHRALAMLRGRNEGVLQLALVADPDQEADSKGSICETMIAEHYGLSLGSAPADRWRKQVIAFAWRVKILMHLETELMASLKERAESDAIDVFAANLKDVLMAAPAGPRCTLGIDPGLRTGCKVAVVDGTGKLLDTATIYPTAPRHDVDGASKTVLNLIKRHQVNLIAIGNGTASRETEAFAKTMLSQAGLAIQTVMVSEAGASVYSASELAANEFPDLDVSLRGAVSIARRLQDPLAELVKIDPKSIGVGQYQHDVSQSQLAKKLDAVVEDCVNAVGVDLNSASAPLLTRVAGLSQTMAQNIVAFRDENGRFGDRKTLLKVPRLGPKAFEQCAGFLRVMDGANPLDRSGVHPETYSLVKRIAEKTGKAVEALVGNNRFLQGLNAKEFADDNFGAITVTDVLNELAKPGRDPRPEFKTATFAEGINQVSDLKPGMQLEGVVTNVTHFGAFVDVGVHQDGLVHISALSNRFVSDPREVVKAGDVVKVKVMEVDVPRKRIGLSMRLDDTPSGDSASQGQGDNHKAGQYRPSRKAPRQPAAPIGGSMADAFARAKRS